MTAAPVWRSFELVFAVRRLAPDGLEAWKPVVERGYESYVAKDEASTYVGGPTRAWLKVKMPGWTLVEDRAGSGRSRRRRQGDRPGRGLVLRHRLGARVAELGRVPEDPDPGQPGWRPPDCHGDRPGQRRVGEKFNVQVALYAAVIAALVVAGCGLAWQLIVIPRRRHDEQAPRLREFELRVEVGRAIGAPYGLRSRSVSSPPRGTETRESSHPAIDYPPPGVVCSRARTHFGSTGTRERRWTEPMPTLDDLEMPDIEYN